jgi:hypothetical protein
VTKNNIIKKMSDTYGSNFNQANSGALEKLRGTKIPGASGWGCRDALTVNQLMNNLPSESRVDERHFS